MSAPEIERLERAHVETVSSQVDKSRAKLQDGSSRERAAAGQEKLAELSAGRPLLEHTDGNALGGGMNTIAQLRARLSDGHLLSEAELSQLEAAEAEAAEASAAEVAGLRQKLADGHMLSTQQLSLIEAAEAEAAEVSAARWRAAYEAQLRTHASGSEMEALEAAEAGGGGGERGGRWRSRG